LPEAEEKGPIDEIADFVKNLSLEPEVFKGHAEATPVHSIIINEIGRKWNKDRGLYTEKFSQYGIDFVGREKNFGKIILATEVDRGHSAQRSWNKLADIRSENKLWVYVTDKPDAQAERLFKSLLNNIRRFLEFRGEDVSSFGKFAAILKTPKDFKFEWILTDRHEPIGNSRKVRKIENQ